MRLSRLIWAGAFVAILGLSASSAKADGVVDPTVHIKDPDSCPTLIVFTGNAIDVSLDSENPLECLTYEGDQPIYSLILTFVPATGVQYGVSNTDPDDIFHNPVLTSLDLNVSPITESFFLSGGEIDPGEAVNVSADCGPNDPTLTCLSGGFDIIVHSPEPSSLSLLLVGLLPLFWFGRKFRSSGTAA
jgi:hypothetical protein